MPHFLVLSLAVAGLALIAGCAAVPEGTAKKATAVNQVRTVNRSLNCELKNGRSGCIDEGEQAAEAKRNREVEASRMKIQQTAAVKIQSSQNADFAPWMCKEGGGGMVGFLGSVATGRLDRLMKYCERIESVQNEPDDSSSGSAASGDSDTGGTWYCDTWDGSGVYGIYRMRENSRVNPATCKKVSS